MEYKRLAEIYEKLENTPKRLEKTEIISDFLKELPSDDLEKTILLMQGKVFPDWDAREIGVAAQTMAKAISLSSGMTAQAIEQEWKKTGDLGQTAENLVARKTQHTLASSSLSVDKVFDNLRKIASESGSSSTSRKINLLAQLLAFSEKNEAKYVTRTVLGDLRIGVGDGVMRDAIAWATLMRVEEGMSAEDRERYNGFVDAVQNAFNLTADFAEVYKAAKKGIRTLKSVRMSSEKPVRVMMALKAGTATEAFARVGRPAMAEFKYDGFRLEIVKDNKGKIRLYTRRLDNVTAQFPELAEQIEKNVKGKSFILDSEAVGYDGQTKKYLPFQKISQRIKRKHDIEKVSHQLPVEVNVFDILSYEGKNLIKEPFLERRQLLEKIVNSIERKVKLSENRIVESEEDVELFFERSKQAGNEGLIIKNLKAIYKPGARVGHMIKFKKALETLDLVIIGAEWGEGKRSRWLSSYNLACFEQGKLFEVGKVSTGLKEKKEEGLSFDEITEMLKPLIISENGKQVEVKPKIIIEVAYEEIQKSPSYSSGYALRFPRVVRDRSSEKDVKEANSLEDLKRLYERQKTAKQ